MDRLSDRDSAPGQAPIQRDSTLKRRNLRTALFLVLLALASLLGFLNRIGAFV